MSNGEPDVRPDPVWASRIDATVAHPARRYDYWLGGKDNFAADRASGDAVAAIYPAIRTTAIENRRFLRRAVTYLVNEGGVRQFLDIGTGIPAADNTHEVAQSIAPDARVVYVDNDPIVLAHARALLTSSPQGLTAYLDADLRDPGGILGDQRLRATLDLGRPVALMLIAIMHFIVDDDDPYGIVRRLLEAMPSGSHLVMSHATTDFATPEEVRRAESVWQAPGQGPFRFRCATDFMRFFDGLELVSPGMVPVAEWRAGDEPVPRPSPAEASMYAAIGRKP